MSDDIIIFDRAAVRRHRERSALFPGDTRFLHRAVQERLIDRLNDVRHRFARVLDLGVGDGGLAALLAEAGQAPDIVSFDPAWRFARQQPMGVVGEAEALPFRAASFDLVVSALGLHWTNDLPGALLQLRHILKPDGLLLATLYGGRTLWELQEVLMQAEIEVAGGAAPRVSPFADVPDCGALLQRAGLALPVVDSETLTVTYPHLFALMQDLRAMGETNAQAARQRGGSRRALFLRAAEIYRERFGDADGRVPATFQLINLTGWAPAASQQQPLKRGSATARLADALGTEERPAGDAVPH
ncbi:MAG TPA: methyltransferase domain-containing protein [Aliidongia sp.]|uniref:methyltransferase domain-containing protein n=1 Tax=Aliidongia sp. TaxID=1914230 RepID=UPI002DDD4526|nr:methyltransferase domain-containing protein [Aliidongia sp.]HEV2675180.1 methyltransferase domain-containing protein [Aliidongia sp.]